MLSVSDDGDLHNLIRMLGDGRKKDAHEPSSRAVGYLLYSTFFWSEIEEFGYSFFFFF